MHFLRHANTLIISFLVFAVKLSSKRLCYANHIPEKYITIYLSKSDHVVSDMPCREQHMYVLSNSYRVGLELSQLKSFEPVPKYIMPSGRHPGASFRHKLRE